MYIYIYIYIYMCVCIYVGIFVFYNVLYSSTDKPQQSRSCEEVRKRMCSSWSLQTLISSSGLMVLFGL